MLAHSAGVRQLDGHQDTRDNPIAISARAKCFDEYKLCFRSEKSDVAAPINIICSGWSLLLLLSRTLPTPGPSSGELQVRAAGGRRRISSNIFQFQL